MLESNQRPQRVNGRHNMTSGSCRPLCTVRNYVYFAHVNRLGAMQNKEDRLLKVHIILTSRGDQVVCSVQGVDGARRPTASAQSELDPSFAQAYSAFRSMVFRRTGSNRNGDALKRHEQEIRALEFPEIMFRITRPPNTRSPQPQGFQPLG